ncbi:MAG: DUF2807 domain-containing protein [Bacteroidetes bacterium]|nr:DUF2807 domain-containing protein [Bacteroidota bacterium]
MKKLIYIFIFALTVVLVNSCKKENAGDCFKSSGKAQISDRALSAFYKIRVEDRIDVFITQSPVYSVKVEAGKNLLSNIKTEVKDSTLYISNINKCNFIRHPKNSIVKVFVTLPYLKRLRNGGVGVVTFENQFTQDSMYVSIANSGDIHLDINLKYLHTSTHGNGDIYAKGFVDYGNHYTNGTNYLRFQDLIIKNRIDLNSYTIGHCYINAPTNPTGGLMKLEIWEAGNIYYKGEPDSLNLTRKGRGELIRE